MKKFFKYLFLAVVVGSTCGYFLLPTVNAPKGTLIKSNKNENKEIDQIKLPESYKIELYAEDVAGARSMSLSPSGTLFVGSMGEGNVYALKDTDGDFVVDEKYTLYEEGNLPNGVAFKDGDLYIAEVNRILKIQDVENKLENPGIPEVVYDEYPTDKHHGWKYIAFGPDGKLYVPVGAPCNICESENSIYASITRLDKDGSNLEIVQTGIRNTVGFNWHPETNELWFTDNGGDMMGDDIPACELNRAPKEKMNFGYPYCHQGDLPDPDFGKNRNCDEFTAPLQNLGAHVAPLGMEFYKEGMLDTKYKNTVFIAEHGSWNRTKKSGYRISTVQYDDNFQATSYKVFADGWLDDESQEVWGRPVDLEYLPDGSLLVSDDYGDAIYRISKI